MDKRNLNRYVIKEHIIFNSLVAAAWDQVIYPPLSTNHPTDQPAEVTDRNSKSKIHAIVATLPSHALYYFQCPLALGFAFRFACSCSWHCMHNTIDPKWDLLRFRLNERTYYSRMAGSVLKGLLTKLKPLVCWAVAPAPPAAA